MARILVHCHRYRISYYRISITILLFFGQNRHRISLLQHWTGEHMDEFSFSDWQKFLLGKLPSETWQLFSLAHKNSVGFAKRYEFNCAVLDRFENMYYLSSIISDEDRAECKKCLEEVEKYIMEDFLVQRDKFLQAREYSIEYYKRFGGEIMRKHMYESKLIDGLGDGLR